MTHVDKARRILQHGDAAEKAAALVRIAYWEVVPEDVILLIDSLRNDRAVTRMYIPFRYGELGYLATRIHALLQYRRGVGEPETIRETVLPLKGEDLSRLCEANGIELDSDDPVDWFVALKKRGLLKVEDETFDERSFDLSE
jgi:hypothetical protein